MIESPRKKTLIDSGKSFVTDESSLDKIEHGIDEDDLAIVKKAVRVAKVIGAASDDLGKCAKRPLTVRAPTSDGKPAPPEVPRGGKLRPLPSGTEDISLAEAKQYFPPRKLDRCEGHQTLLPMVLLLSQREPPKYVTKSWGPTNSLSVREALQVVIRGAWAMHAAEGHPEPCPFNLEVLDL